MDGWHAIYITTEIERPSIAKGRYLAAKEFYEWLQSGGEIEEAGSWLIEAAKRWKDDENLCQEYLFSIEMTTNVDRGMMTLEESRRWKYAENTHDTPEEKAKIDFLKWQFLASQVEIEHLRRLLKNGTPIAKPSLP